MANPFIRLICPTILAIIMVGEPTFTADATTTNRQAAESTPAADPCLIFTDEDDDHDHDVDHHHEIGDEDDHVHEWDIAEGDPISITEVPFDLLFIDTMIPHHEGAILMAEVAHARSVRPEIVDLSHTIIAQQQAEIDQLREWRASWYSEADPVPVPFQMALLDEGMMLTGIPADAGMGMAVDHLDATADARALCAIVDPIDFDREFIDRMIRHHQGAIGMAQLAIARAENEPLLPFAQAMVDLQTQEIALLADWHNAWFGASAPDATPGA